MYAILPGWSKALALFVQRELIAQKALLLMSFVRVARTAHAWDRPLRTHVIPALPERTASTPELPAELPVSLVTFVPLVPPLTLISLVLLANGIRPVASIALSSVLNVRLGTTAWLAPVRRRIVPQAHTNRV